MIGMIRLDKNFLWRFCGKFLILFKVFVFDAESIIDWIYTWIYWCILLYLIMNRNFNTVIWPLASFGHFFVRTLKRTTTFAILCRWMSLWSTRYMSTNNSTTSTKSMWCQMQLQCCILLSGKWFQHGTVSHRLDTKENSVSCIRVNVT